MRIKKGHEERARNAIINILASNRSLTNSINIVSFVNDGIVFSSGYNQPINIWNEQFIKYLRFVIPHSGYKIKYSHPYKSKSFKNITEFDVYKDDVFIIGDKRCDKETAELSAYIEILQKCPSFDSIYQEYFKKVEPIIDLLPANEFRVKKTSSFYKVSDDLREILNNKSLLRQYRLSLIDI